MRVLLACAALLALTTTAANAALCAKWSTATQLDEIDAVAIKEASGLAVSRKYDNRHYHNQDSGDGPFFYITGKGAPLQKVEVKGMKPLDVEELALGPCGKNRTCLYLADFGDNPETRETVTFTLLREKARYGKRETPLRTVVAKYPDKAHNAEGFALHPNGDLYVITKSFNQADRRALPAQVFKLTAAQLTKPKRVETFTEVGVIDLPYLLYDYGLGGQIVTGMDMAADGSKIIALTYRNVIEMNIDVTKPLKPSRQWLPTIDYRITPIVTLPQAEAITYSVDGNSILYTSEMTVPGAKSYIWQSTCEPAAETR